MGAAKSVFAHAPTLARKATKAHRIAFPEADEEEDLLQSEKSRFSFASMSHEEQSKARKALCPDDCTAGILAATPWRRLDWR